jgi:mannose-6-phosphate isomerase-like protein (cupin superfamily)
MSFPEPRYLGDEGEISAKYRPTNQKPDLTIGERVKAHYLTTGESTNGRFGLYRWDMVPHRPAATPHFHRTMSESFFVLSGKIRLFNGERWIDAMAGDFLYVPEGGIHGFQNDSDEPASMLILFAPGVPREGYFEALADIAAGRQFTDEEWANICIKYDNYFIDSKSRSLYQKLLSQNR